MGSIIIKELKIMLKEKGNFFFLILMPIMFIVLFATVLGDIGDSTITITYTDEDQSGTSETFLKSIAEIDGIELERVTGPVEAEVARIKEGKLSSLLVIPEGFEKRIQAGDAPVQIEFYRDAAPGEPASPIQAVLDNVAGGYREHKLVSALNAMGVNEQEASAILQSPIEVKEVAEKTVGGSVIEHIVPGYMVMFVFFIWISMVNRFQTERDSGMVARLRSTPMKPPVYLVGMWVPAIISVLIQCAVLLAFGYFVYDIHLGDVGLISLIVLCLALCGTGLGLGLSLVVKSFNQGLAITQVFALGGAMVAGLWFPMDMMPEFVQTIGEFTPQYWAQKGLQDVMVRGAHIGDVWPTFAVLLAFCAAGLLIALWRYKHFLRTAVN